MTNYHTPEYADDDGNYFDAHMEGVNLPLFDLIQDVKRATAEQRDKLPQDERCRDIKRGLDAAIHQCTLLIGDLL